MDLGSSLQLDSILSPECGDDCSDGGDTTRLSIIITIESTVHNNVVS